MGEDMHEELPVGVEPSGDPLHQFPVVLHVLEHLHGDRAVVGARLGRAEGVHVGRDDPDIVELAALRLRLDVKALGVGVGHRRDRGIRVVLGHPERERSPAATEFEDLLAILEFRPLAGELEHCLLGFREGGVRGGPVTAAVFEAGPEDVEVELRRHLIMLLVGIGRVDRDRGGIEARAECRETRIPRLEITNPLLAQLG